jgi:hypothetical protein
MYREIKQLEEGTNLEISGIEGSEGMYCRQMKGRLKKAYTRISRIILKSEFNAKNKITPTGT